MKGSIEVTKDELNTIILSLEYLKNNMKQAAKNEEQDILKSHFKKSASKYQMLQNKLIKRRSELFK